MTKKLAAFLAVFALIAAGVYLMPTHKLSAQQTGVASVPGQVFGQNQFAQTVATQLAGAVTNPSSNFIINVAGGPIYFNGSIQEIGQATMTLTASTTYLIVWNGTNETLYAKTAVTGPGSPSVSSGASVNSPGVPTSLLFAYPNVEVPLATVVCGTTNCGNTANGSITDNRPLGNFPAGLYVGGHLNSTVAGTAAAMAFQGTCTLSGNTCTMTFSQAFQSAPVCVATDQTTPQLVKAPATTASVIVTDTVGATDVVSVICVGNPN